MQCRYCKDSNFKRCSCCRGTGYHPGKFGCTGIALEDTPGLNGKVIPPGSSLEQCSGCDGVGEVECEHPDLIEYYGDFEASPLIDTGGITRPADGIPMPGEGYSGYSVEGDQSGRNIQMDGRILCHAWELTGELKVTWNITKQNAYPNSGKRLATQCDIDCPQCKSPAVVYFYWPVAG